MKLPKIKIDPNKMEHIEIGAEITKPLITIGVIIYILLAVFAVNNLINYFN